MSEIASHETGLLTQADGRRKYRFHPTTCAICNVRPKRRPNDAYCNPCRAAFMRAWRAKVKAETNHLRGVVAGIRKQLERGLS